MFQPNNFPETEFGNYRKNRLVIERDVDKDPEVVST